MEMCRSEWCEAASLKSEMKNKDLGIMSVENSRAPLPKVENNQQSVWDQTDERIFRPFHLPLPDVKASSPLSYFLVAGSGQGSVHFKQPAGWNPDHAQQRRDPQHRLRRLRGSFHHPAVAVLHAHGEITVVTVLIHYLSAAVWFWDNPRGGFLLMSVSVYAV